MEESMTTLVKDAPVRNRFAPAAAAWRTVITHVQPEGEMRPRLEAAADLARKLDATLIGIGAEMIPPYISSDPYGFMGGEFIVAMQEAIQANLERGHNTFRQVAASQSHEWVAVEEMPCEAVARISRGADLIVAGGSPLNDRDGYRWCDPAELVLKAGRPVLVAPPAGGKLTAEAVVVAWKDTREARRALSDSLPLLKCADEVVIVEVCAKDEAQDAEPRHAALTHYLSRHGVTARSRIIPAHADEAAFHLHAEAGKAGADLIVAGGYGHTRLGEWVFGGVTADLLSEPLRFVLFSH
jgi:nucleotide-binding universal stress UspA family protein